MEKVVERIVLMPQVHEVTRHIYDITEEAHPGIAVDVDFQTHERNYKQLYSVFKNDTSSLIRELKAMQKGHPELAERIQILQNYISQLDELAAYPKIVQITKDRTVNKQVPIPIKVPAVDPINVQTEAFYLVLIEKLLTELRTIKQKDTSFVLKDKDLETLFFSSASQQHDRTLREKISKFKQSKEGATILRSGRGQSQDSKETKKEESGLSSDRFSSILYEKFQLASLAEKSSVEVDRFRRISEERLELLHQYKQINDVLHQRLLASESKLRQLIKEQSSSINKNIL